MASLPTAYASQRFGRKSLDFYAAAGDVIGADPRARADERRLQDLEGARHTVRLMDTGFQLDPGQPASVLRMQPGPARRSRPVAVVNHDSGAWSRTHPGAAGLLARAGVSRTLNWTLTMLVFALAALAVVWPYLRAFLIEIDPAAFTRAPELDVFALAAGLLPGLADWRIDPVAAPLTAAVSDLAPGLAAFTPQALFAAAVLLAAGLVLALRSWRLVWVPVLVAGLLAAAMGFDGAAGAVTPALAGLGLAAGVFLIGGVINRIRDAARLERRIAVLADHIVRHPPEEMVAGADGAEDDPAAEHDDARQGASVTAAALGASHYRTPEDPPGDDAEATPDAEESGAQPHADAETPPQREASSDPGADAQPDADVDAAAADEGSGGDETTPDEGEADEPHATAEAERRKREAEGAVDAGETEAPASETPAADDPGAEDPGTGVPGAEAQEADALEPDAPGAEAEADAADSDGGSDPAAEGAPDTEPDPAPNTFEQEETERLRTDPRYASRAIVLPPPPPMPVPDGDEASGDAATDEAGAGAEPGSEAPRSQTRTLQPGAPLPPNVVPMFAAPAPSKTDDEPET